MKVAFVTSVYGANGLGGAERTVQTLAEALVSRGQQASVISLAPDGRSSEGELNGVRTFYVPLANFYWPFGRSRNALLRAAWNAVDAYNPVMGARLGRILDSERPDVLQTGNLLGFSVSAWQAARRRGIPIVQMLHDYYLACPNSSMFRRGSNCPSQCGRCRIYGLPRRLMSDTPAAVISLSQRTLDRLEGCGLFPGVTKKVVIHGASNFEIHRKGSAAQRKADGLTLGYLGRIEPTKGIELVLDAALRIPGRRVRVLLGGKGPEPYVAALRERYASADVEFIGFVRPQEFFERIDLLAVPSLWEEPLGRVIYEAYAHGIPSIVTRMGGMPEIVEDGSTGFVVEPGDVDALARLLEGLASRWHGYGLGEAFRRACLHKAREFRIEFLIDRYLDVWRGAAGLPLALLPLAAESG